MSKIKNYFQKRKEEKIRWERLLSYLPIEQRIEYICIRDKKEWHYVNVIRTYDICRLLALFLHHAFQDTVSWYLIIIPKLFVINLQTASFYMKITDKKLWTVYLKHVMMDIVKQRME